MIDEVNFDPNSSLYIYDQDPSCLFSQESIRPLSAARQGDLSQKVWKGKSFSIDPSTMRKKGDPYPYACSIADEKVASAALKTIEVNERNASAQTDSKGHKYFHKQGGVGGYLLGIGEMILGGTLMATGAVIEIGSIGLLTIGVGFQEAAGFALITDGFARTIMAANDVSLKQNPNRGISIPHLPLGDCAGASNSISKNDAGCPRSRELQDKQFKDAVRELEKKLGKKLDPSDVRELHDHVSGQGYGYHELIEEGYWLLGGS